MSTQQTERRVRPTWDETFMTIAEVMSKRATCPRLSTGAVIIDSTQNRILSTGYNGAPRGADHCTDKGCIMEEGHCIRVVHAEANAVLYGARRGICLSGGTMFVLHVPCPRCAMILAQAGIREVIYKEHYGTATGIDRLISYGISVRRIGVQYASPFIGTVNPRRRKSDSL